jgi:F-type H+-transporting ATPase subunit a
MMAATLGSTPLLQIGPVGLTETVVTTWAIMLALAVFCRLATRRLSLDPGPLQTALEGLVCAIEDAIAGLLPGQATAVLPVVGTLWIFILIANLAGIVPGVHAPTGDISVTAALAVVVFLSVHWYGLRAQGWRQYLRHYARPNPLLLPFHLLSEITRTLALAIRLFGNTMSLEMTALLVLLVAGFLVPIPILMLHVVEAVVQAYIFGVLALIYIAGATQFQAERMNIERETP